MELIRHSYNLLEINIEWTSRCDHAGPRIELGLLGYEFCIRIYDTRHWDYALNTWEIY